MTKLTKKRFSVTTVNSVYTVEETFSSGATRYKVTRDANRNAHEVGKEYLGDQILFGKGNTMRLFAGNRVVLRTSVVESIRELTPASGRV